MAIYPITNITIALGCLVFIGWILIAFISCREKETLAARRSVLLAIISASPFWAGYFLPRAIQNYWSIFMLSFTGLVIILLFLPIPNRQKNTVIIPHDYRFDERETMFSRAELIRGTKQFNDYYSSHPEHKITDDKFRKSPGLLSPDASYYHPDYFKKARILFDEIARKRDDVDGSVNPVKKYLKPDIISRLLKEQAVQSGAASVGITELKPYHFYSVSGRGKRYGQGVNTPHRFAIALTVEMDYDAVAFAPKAPTVLESARQYLNSGLIALKIAREIRSWGYGARAHIDGNYLLICPLVARDAGLGEIGRMGLLITPTLGPRVRIAVVTTDLLLQPDRVGPDPSVADFCQKCQKCAVNCPAGAIPMGNQKNVNGVRRWKINDTSCYAYWCKVGTDCAQCMRVCPYSHRDTFFHNFIRFGIRHFPVFRRFALKMDDLLYGKHPTPRAS